jgi:hypothetical protein
MQKVGFGSKVEILSGFAEPHGLGIGTATAKALATKDTKVHEGKRRLVFFFLVHEI